MADIQKLYLMLQTYNSPELSRSSKLWVLNRKKHASLSVAHQTTLQFQEEQLLLPCLTLW